MAQENSDKGGWRGGYSELGGDAWPPGSPSRPNLGLCFLWPCPSLPPCWKTGCLRQWGRRPKGLSLNAASQGTAPGPHLGLQLWLGVQACLCLTPALCTDCVHFSCLSPHSPCPLSLALPVMPVFPRPCLPIISPCLAGGGAHGSSISGVTLRLGLVFLPLTGVGLTVSPLCPFIPVSALSPSWLALPHLSLSCLRLSESLFL